MYHSESISNPDRLLAPFDYRDAQVKQLGESCAWFIVARRQLYSHLNGFPIEPIMFEG